MGKKVYNDLQKMTPSSYVIRCSFEVEKSDEMNNVHVFTPVPYEL
jgi:hypothetical protein